MQVKDLMNPHVWSIRADATLDAATRIMWNEDIGALPVVDEWNHPVGVVTDRNVAMSAAINGQPLSNLIVARCMSSEVFLCEETASVEAAAGLMRAHRVRRIPVVDEAQRLTGMIALGDLVRAVGGKAGDAKTRRAIADEVVRTLEAICAPHGGEPASEAIVEVKPTKARAAKASKAKAPAASGKSRARSAKATSSARKTTKSAAKPAASRRKVGKKKATRRKPAR